MIDSTADNGRTIEVEVGGDATGQRLDRFLADTSELDLTRSRIQNLIAAGAVTVDERTLAKNYRLRGGERITVTIPPLAPTHLKGEDIPLDIVHEDDDLLVVNKPPGLVTHPAPGHSRGTLVNAVIHHLGARPQAGDMSRPGIVHRLDKNTSGLIMIARTEAAYLSLQRGLQERSVKRTYLALVCGHVTQESGSIDLPIGRSSRDRKKMTVSGLNPRDAVTTYTLRERYRTYDLLDVELQTGRTHQIRVHLSHLGHPVFGDPDYGGRDKWHRGIFAPERPLGKRLLSIMPRQALHARRLVLAHPSTGEELTFECDPPEDFLDILEMLEREGR